MYCSKCGNKQENGEKFCSQCGSPFLVDEHQTSSVNDTIKINVQESSNIETNNKNKTFAEKLKDGLYVGVALIIPILGLIFYFVKRKKDKALAKSILISFFIGLTYNIFVYYYNNSDEFDFSYYEPNNEYYETSTNNVGDKELTRVLNRIAGTYELVENAGIYGLITVYTVVINKDGTGRTVFKDGSIENFYGAYLDGSNRIVFSGDYGGTPFKLSGVGIDDESALNDMTPYGTPKYVMRKIK